MAAKIIPISSGLSPKGDAPITSRYQLKITLKNVKPPVWRRIEVQGNVSLGDLGRIIQMAMGWHGGHLHQFNANGDFYANPDFELDDAENENRVCLAEIAPTKGSSFSYDYDFGDSWEHIIKVEKIINHATSINKKPAACLGGKRNCPPEDSGGSWGYANFLQAIKDPKHPEHEEMLEWIGGSFDPEKFNAEAINSILQGLT